MNLLEPLDYSRASAGNLVRGGYRLSTGQGDWRDALGMVPGAAGILSGTLFSPLAGAGVAAGLHGLGRLAGLVPEGPSTADVVGAVGGDEESTLQNLLAQVATDPLTYAGAFQGGKALAGRLAPRAAAPLEAIGGEGAVLSDSRKAAALQRQLRNEMAAAGSEGPAGAAPMDPAGSLGPVGPEGLYSEANRPPSPPPTPPGLPPPTYTPGQSEYRGQVGIMGDAIKDMLGQGYADPAERLAVSRMSGDALGMANDLTLTRDLGGGPGLPRLTPEELAPLRARHSLTSAELGARQFIPHPTEELQRVIDNAMEQTGGGPGNATMSQLMKRSLPPGFQYPGSGGMADLVQLRADATQYGDAGTLRAARAQQQRVQSYAKAIADARINNPEVMLADQFAEQMHGLSQGTMNPEATAAAVRRARQYGLPIEPEMVAQRFAQNAGQNVYTPLNTLESTSVQLPAFMEGNRGALEAMRNRAGGELLRLIGPQGMADLAAHPARSMESGAWHGRLSIPDRGAFASQQGNQLSAQLRQALGLPPAAG